MSLTLANLLAEYRLAIRNTGEGSVACYAALNSVKDEAVTKIINFLKASALNSVPSEHTITLTGNYTYSVSATPSIRYILEVKTNNNLGTHYREMERVESPWHSGMGYNSLFPTYRFYGSSFQFRGDPTAGGLVIISYLGAITDVSDLWIITTSGLTDEAERMWCWYAAARHWENVHEDKEAARCYKIFNQKLYGTQRGF